MKKNNFKKVVFYSHPILGDYTIQELINFLENQLIRNKQLDDKLFEILTDKGFTIKQINNLLRIADTSYNLEFIINMLNDNI